jgi:hypothetical protein
MYGDISHGDEMYRDVTYGLTVLPILAQKPEMQNSGRINTIFSKIYNTWALFIDNSYMIGYVMHMAKDTKASLLRG